MNDIADAPWVGCCKEDYLDKYRIYCDGDDEYNDEDNDEDE